jgi:membrane-bound ClpP family serine protease
MENEILKNAWQYYYYLAWFATIFFAIKLIIFSVFGGDGSEVHGDFNTEIDSDPTFSFISLQSILAFLMGFGWMGYACLQEFKFSQIITLLCAIGVGIVFMFLTAFLMFSVRKLEKNVKKDKATAVGKIGKAYSNFSPKGYGQVEIEINGQLMVAEAVNNEDEEIKAFDPVRVLKVENELLYIKKEI